MPHLWNDWIAVRRIWWVQLLYCILLLTSYALFAYVLGWLIQIESPNLLQILLLAVGSFLGIAAICISIIDCILLFCRTSDSVLPLVIEPQPLQALTPRPNPMLGLRRVSLGQSIFRTPTEHHASESKEPDA